MDERREGRNFKFVLGGGAGEVQDKVLFFSFSTCNEALLN